MPYCIALIVSHFDLRFFSRYESVGYVRNPRTNSFLSGTLRIKRWWKSCPSFLKSRLLEIVLETKRTYHLLETNGLCGSAASLCADKAARTIVQSLVAKCRATGLS